MKPDLNSTSAVIVSVMLLYLGWVIFSLVVTFRLRAMREAVLLLFAVFIGWELHAYPGRTKNDTMLLVFLKVWWQSAIALTWASFKLFGLVDAWNWLVRLVS